MAAKKVKTAAECQKEGDVKKLVQGVFDEHKWFWWMPPANGFGKPNVDFNAIRGGVFIAVETKFHGNKPSVLQKAFLASIISEDGFGFVVDEKNFLWFKGFMEAFDRSAQAVAGSKQPDDSDGAYMMNAIHELTKVLA